MMDHTENRGNHPNLDQLSTAELEDLLRADFSASGDEGPDLDAVLAIMEVINSREEENIPDGDIDAAWAAFRTNVIENEDSLEEAPANPVFAPAETPKAPKEPHRRPRKLRWVVAAAAVVCLMVCLLTVPTLGGSGAPSLVQWTDGTFSFGRDRGIDESRSKILFSELESQVSAITDLPVLPQWYPEGTTIEQVEEYEVTGIKDICAVFERQGETFSFVVTVYETVPEQMGGYEKNEGPPEQYYVNGIPHYIMGNMDRTVAVWRNENAECFIQGNLTVNELKTMIDSIYR